MELKFLPNTAVAASIVSKDEIYTYAQLYDGRIVEIQGRLAGENDTYQPTGTQNAIDMTMSGRDFAAKRFTPLAAVYFESQVSSSRPIYLHIWIYANDISSVMCSTSIRATASEASLARTAPTGQMAPSTRLAG